VTPPVVGIDVGARELHLAALDGGGVAETAAVDVGELDTLRRLCKDATAVAIDAPAAPSSAPHVDDESLAPKFRAARCAEIDLGRRHGSWVPWVAPLSPPFPDWITAGFAVYAALSGAGRALLEVYPYACFRALAGGRRPARKQTAAGRRDRIELLRRAGVPPAGVAGLSHHGLDAVVAAVVARDQKRGQAERVTCGHDRSAIWLPRATL
jgi:predicted nuclease with RNAse H fold